MRDNIHELESQEDGAETLGYDEVYYSSTSYTTLMSGYLG